MRYSEATWIPSPNFGYPRGTHGQLKTNIDKADKSGEFWHSQQGRQAVSIGMFQDPALEVSAQFLIPKVGKPVQMVDSNDAAWHTGNYLANLHFHGFEFEGGPPGNLREPLTTSQIAWGVKITHWLRQVHGTPTRYVRKDTLWEHNEVRATACPSGRIPWVKVIGLLEIEEEEEDMAKLIKKSGSGTVYATDGLWKWGIPSSGVLKELQAAGLVSGGIKTVSSTLFSRLKTTHNPIKATTGGLTSAQDKSLTEIQNSLRGGDLPGIWWKVKGKGTIYYVELVGGVLVRHHARNPESYTNMGGDWKVKAVSQAQLDVTIAGPPLPNLKV